MITLIFAWFDPNKDECVPILNLPPPPLKILKVWYRVFLALNADFCLRSGLQQYLNKISCWILPFFCSILLLISCTGWLLEKNIRKMPIHKGMFKKSDSILMFEWNECRQPLLPTECYGPTKMNLHRHQLFLDCLNLRSLRYFYILHEDLIRRWFAHFCG